MEKKSLHSLNIIEDLDSLIGLNVKEAIEYIESKLSHCYEIVARDNVVNGIGYSCGIEYRKPFSGILYIDFNHRIAKMQRGIAIQFNKRTNLAESYRISCNKR